MREATVKHFERAMTLDAREPLFPYCYAIEKSRRGDVDGAFKLYERTIQVDPTFAQAHCNLASILQSRGRFEEALESYTRGHELSARKPDWNYPSAWWVERTRRIVDLSKQKTPPRLEAAALKEGVSGGCGPLYTAVFSGFWSIFSLKDRVVAGCGVGCEFKTA